MMKNNTAAIRNYQRVILSRPIQYTVVVVVVILFRTDSHHIQINKHYYTRTEIKE